MALHDLVEPRSRLGVNAEARHVLDDRDGGDAHLVEHLDALDNVDKGEALRRGDEHRRVDAELLRAMEAPASRQLIAEA